MWELEFGDLKEGERFDPSIHAAAEKALRDEGIDDPQHAQARTWPTRCARFSDVYNEAWGDNWGFVPITDAEIEFHAKILKQVLDEDWAFIAEKDGEAIGAALTLPDINQVLAKLNGRLLPFGWLQVPARQAQDRPGARLRPRRQARLPPHRRRRRPLPQAPRDGARPGTIEGGEMGWILETNEPMNRAMEGMGGEVVKRYRVYEKRGFRSAQGAGCSAASGASGHR